VGFASLGPTSEAKKGDLNSVRGRGERLFVCLRFGVACAREFCAGSKGWKPRIALARLLLCVCLSVCLFVCLFPCVTAGGFRISVFVACFLVNAVSQMLQKIGSKVSVK
jgi:hypothetical protein